MAGQVEVDRIAPRAPDVVGPDDEDRLPPVGEGRDVDEVAAVMLDQVHRPDAAHRLVERGGDRRPVHQVARMPDDDAGHRVEAGEGHVIVGAILEDGRVRMVAGDDRIEEEAVAEIGLALAFEAGRPGVERRGAGAPGGRRGRLGGERLYPGRRERAADQRLQCIAPGRCHRSPPLRPGSGAAGEKASDIGALPGASWGIDPVNGFEPIGDPRPRGRARIAIEVVFYRPPPGCLTWPGGRMCSGPSRTSAPRRCRCRRLASRRGSRRRSRGRRWRSRPAGCRRPARTGPSRCGGCPAR